MRKTVMAGLGGGIILLFALVAAFYFYPPFTLWTQQVAARFEMQNAYVITGVTFEDARIERLGFFKNTLVSFPFPGRVFDYAYGGGTEAALSVENSGEQYVYINSGDGWNKLPTDEAIKSKISVSENGKLIAFAERRRDADASAYFYTPASWNVSVYNIELDESTVYERLYAPQFFVRDEIQFLFAHDESGIYVNEYGTEREQRIQFGGTYNGRWISRISTDGMVIGQFSERGTYDMFPLESVFPLIVGPQTFSLPDGSYFFEIQNKNIYIAQGDRDADVAKISIISLEDLDKEIVIRKNIVDIPLKIIPR